VVALVLTIVLAIPAPVTRAGMFDFTLKDEKELGEEFAVLIKSQLPLIEDPAVKGYVERLTTRIAAEIPPQPWEINTYVVYSNTMNAFAAPAGHVFIFSGLIANLEDEGQLAAVVAHELAHVTERHIARKVEASKKTALLTMVGALAGAFLGGDAGMALAQGSMAAGVQESLRYSRENETEADQLGLDYLLAAGYPPQPMVRGFEVIKEKNWIRSGNIPGYLSTHPAIDERITYLTGRLKRLPSHQLSRDLDNTEFERVQVLVRARYVDPAVSKQYFDKPDQAMTCLDFMGKGIMSARANRFAQAKANFEKAVDCAPNDPLVLREAARFHFETGDMERAGPLLVKALALDPDDIMTQFFYSRLLAHKGETAKAVEYMQRVLKEVPEDPEVHEYLGRIQGKHGDYFRGHLQLAYAALYRNDQRMLTMHKNKAANFASGPDDQRALKELNEKVEERAEYW
jgi:predicted Zn-dependent protease